MVRKSQIMLLPCLVVALCLAGSVRAELVAHWKLDETSGTTAYDSVDSFHGALANMDPLTDWVSGKINGGLDFDGVDDYVALGDLNVNSDSMTITLWLKSPANQNGYAGLVFRRGADENASGFGFSSQANELGYHWNNQEWDWHSGLIVPNSRWVFAAIAIGPTQATVYLGDPAAGPLVSATNSHASHTEHFNRAAIGADVYSEGGRNFKGVLDDVRIWDTALSFEDINNVYTGGVVPTIEFEAPASIALESVTSALVPVILRNADPNQSYAVSYRVIGGTATEGGVDYTLAPGTLTFNPGETIKNVSIDIVSDGIQEEDETIILELFDPIGMNVALGVSQHTCTISDAAPQVSFGNAASSGLENVTPASIPVALSYASSETITVDYAVTGGTARGSGVDYILEGGTLQFEAGTVTKYITVDIVDDDIIEQDETVILTLSNPGNVTLGAQKRHTYRIIDDEPGVLWDGLVWYYTSISGGPFVNAEGQLEWVPEEEGQYVTRIPTQDFSKPGDKVQMTYWWLTDGATPCNVDDCYSCPRCTGDIRCIAGTSDMRVGLYEADGEYIEQDGYDVKNEIFVGYKGYNFRFGPNMRAEPTRWVDCNGETHKTGNFAKKPPDLTNLMHTNAGLMDYIPGFELPPGEWSLLTISIERTSGSSVRLSITLNGRTYTDTDSSGSGQPQKIDVFGVHMRNGRNYSRLVLDSLCTMGPADFNGDDAVNEEDLGVLTRDWLQTGTYIPGGTPPDANGRVAYYALDETAGTTAHDSANDFDGTLTNMDPTNDWVGGYTNGALEFDGTNDHAALPNLNLNSNTLTITLWLKSNANQSPYAGLVFRRTGDEDASGFDFVGGTNRLGYHWNGAKWDWNSGLVVPNGLWMFTALVIEPTHATIYLYDPDAEDLSSATTSHASYTETLNGAVIGADLYSGGSRYFNGILDEVTIWNYALSESEIFNLANAGKGTIYVPPDSPANLYEDDAVDFKDFAVFASQWLDSCQ